MKIEMKQEEIQALDVLMNDAKVPVKMGFILATFRIRIQEEIMKEQDKQLKDKYGKSKNISKE